MNDNVAFQNEMVTVVEIDAGNIHPKEFISKKRDPVFIIVTRQFFFREHTKIQAEDCRQSIIVAGAGARLQAHQLRHSGTVEVCPLLVFYKFCRTKL